tara:strand:+ start:148 stop:267 length:120 start_codon:yes stop_codon:yes gene_type:complete
MVVLAQATVAADLESNTVSADYYYSLYYVKRSAQNDYAW